MLISFIRRANKTDSIQRKVTLTGLQPGVHYEVVVKAGNSRGTSQLTTPLKFITADQFIIASPAQGSDVGGAVGIVFAVLIVIGKDKAWTTRKDVPLALL